MRSFTLIELMIIIIIVGILATFAMPAYKFTQEHALSREAMANLKLIAAAERIFKMESQNNAYVACSCSDNIDCYNNVDGCNHLLKLNLNPQKWTYEVTASGAGPAAVFTAIAERIGVGGHLDCRYTFTESDVEPTPNASCP